MTKKSCSLLKLVGIIQSYFLQTMITFWDNQTYIIFFWIKSQFYGLTSLMLKVYGPLPPMPKFYGRMLPTPKLGPCHWWTHAPSLPTPPMNQCYICYLHYLVESTRIGNCNPKTTVLKFMNLSPFNQRLAWQCRELRKAYKIQIIFVKICHEIHEWPISIENYNDLILLYPNFVFKEKELVRRIVVE